MRLVMADASPESVFAPRGLLRLFRRLSFERKLGVGELLFGRALALRRTTWIDFGGIRWKLNLANDTHRWLVYGEYEEPGVRRLLERVLDPTSVVIDSGANIGQMVLMVLRCGPPAMIHAFEPTPEARAWLVECVIENALRNVSVSPFALGDRTGAANLLIHDFGFKEGAKNHLVEASPGTPIEITTLDAYTTEHQIERIRLWKLDIEGHELPALRGAQALLQRAAIDFLYLETGNAGEEIATFLAKFGYVAVPIALNRVLTIADVRTRFTNVFVSDRVAREECGLATP